LNFDAMSAIGRVVILTTFGDRLESLLQGAGHSAAAISTSAGPDFTACFERLLADPPIDRTLYVEALNEACEKIRPSFCIELRDGAGQLRGRACGAVHKL